MIEDEFEEYEPPVSVPAFETLYCSQKVGKLSRLEFKLEDSLATGIRAEPIESQEEGTDKGDPVKCLVVLSGAYTGCPHCGNLSFCRCKCGALSCCSENAENHTCPACGTEFYTIPHTEEIELRSGGGK